jgi:hypothetical protein
MRSILARLRKLLRSLLWRLFRPHLATHIRLAVGPPAPQIEV